MINSYQKEIFELNKISKSGYKPSILLHSCCGPCSTYPLTLLKDYFNITIFYNNSNIYPANEYEHRLETLKNWIEIFNKEYNNNVNIITTKYDNESYNKLLLPRKDDKENGPRCRLCYFVRMNEAFKYAKENKFDYCGTVMTMSRQKDEQFINKIGEVLSEKYGIKFLISNFKKKGGQEIRDEIVEKYNLYDQKYCGCIYSYEEKIKKGI